MTMGLHKSIISKLGGHINSNPEIIATHSPLEETVEDTSELLSICLPIGSKIGDIIINKYNKNTLLSYIFAVEQSEHRDDLFSFSLLIDKNINSDIYKTIIDKLLTSLRENNLLTEEILKNHQNLIFESLNEEKDLQIENQIIKLSSLFKKMKKETDKKKPKVKGSFF
ncbi:MAG: hypothetical protein EU547_05030 [Promethearchaeota archaeon]|nr:MAG: hypothetical protein EU547_05030 [Candidatus Lokiarchaeota archaeon]